MAKSGAGRSGPIPPSLTLPGLGGPGQPSSVPYELPHADLEAFLAKGAGAKREVRSPRRPFGTSPAQEREAERLAADGVRLMERARHVEAVAVLQRSLSLNPAVAEVQRHLGAALIAAGRPDQAVGALTNAIRLDPSFAMAHLSLGFAFEALGYLEKAIARYRDAVTLEPNLFGAHLGLGGLYQACGFRAEAAAAFRAAAAAAPSVVAAQNAEVRALEALGQFDEALAAARAIVKAHPKDAQAHMTLGKLLGQAGHSAEAAAHYLRAARLSPELSDAWQGLARNKRFTPDDAPLVARMNAALALPNQSPLARQMMHFALGKAYDDVGDYQEAMRNFEAGNRFRALAGKLDREELTALVDRLSDATPPGYRDRQPDGGSEDATPLLIVGLPRSGSTLIEQVISSHPEVAAGGELEFWVTRYPSAKGAWLPLAADAARRLADDYLVALRTKSKDAKRVTDKMLANFWLLGLIHRLFPNATLIHCRRHPIDTALSMFTTNLAATSARHMARRSDLVFYIRQYQRLMAHWRAVLPSDRFVEVDYEALVADPEPQSRRLIAACGLAWNDACLTPHLNKRRIDTASIWQARQPIYPTSVGRWRRYEPWLGELRELADDP
jgi:tetratricopeptide (TPR) repeat protein